MKQKSKRYLGMTNSQLGILGGAGAVALLLICGLSFLVLMPPPAQVSAPTDKIPEILKTPPSPVVLVVADTPTPTPQPVIATSAPPEDWVEFQTSGATLWMPKNFVGGDMANGRSETIFKVTRLGRYFKNVREAMRSAPSQVVMWMIDNTASGSPVITSLIVMHEVMDDETGIDQYVHNSTKGTATALSTTVYETNKLSVLGREARRVTYQQQVTAGYEITGVAYFIKDGNEFWILDYALDPNEYIDMLSMVKQSVDTFNLVK